jgi:hypothetical protein
MQLTAKEFLKRIDGFSKGRIWWERAKKEAAQRGVDVKVFKAGFGPAVDDFRKTVKGAYDVKALHSTLDDRTLGPVRTKKSKIDKIVADYQKLCRAGFASKTASTSEKGAWNQLEKDLLSVKIELDSWMAGLDPRARR